MFSTKSLLFSRSLNDSSKAISQNGLILNLTPLVSIPVPVLLILGLMAKSITLFTGTKILNLEDILMWLGWVGLGWVGLDYVDQEVKEGLKFFFFLVFWFVEKKKKI